MDIFSLLPLIDGGWDYNYGIPRDITKRTIVLKPSERKHIVKIRYPGWLVALFCDIRGLSKTGAAKYLQIKIDKPIELTLSPAALYSEGATDLETYIVTALAYEVEEDHYVLYLIASPPLPVAEHQLPFHVELFNPTTEEILVVWNITYITIYDKKLFKTKIRELLSEILPLSK